ncbi:MAG: TonB-dependent receptor [Rickettsiales bacterium]|nr:TonB-dependent receptor [Rickettsiales bacterium]
MALTPERRSVALDLWSQLSSNVQFNVYLSKNQFHRNEVNSALINSAIRHDTDSLRARLLADTHYGMIEADIYHNATLSNIDNFSDVFASSIQASFDNHTTVARLSNTFEVGKDHVFRIGTEYRDASNFVSSPLARVDADDLRYEIYTGSALWDWDATDRLATSVAIRYDHFELKPNSTFVSPTIQTLFNSIGAPTPFSDEDYNQTRREISYNVGAVYNIDNNNTIRVSTARGIDLPSFAEFGLQFLSPDFDGNPLDPTFDTQAILGNPYTDTSVITNYELGYDRKIPALSALFRGALFFQTSDDMQSFYASSVDGFAVDSQFLGNIGDSQMYGVELGLQGVLDTNWQWMANYTFLNIEDDFNNQRHSAINFSAPVSFEDSVVNHVFNAGIGYHNDAFHSNIFVQYKTDFDDLEVVPASANSEFQLRNVDDQFIINANINYHINDMVDWQLAANNITGQTNEYVSTNSETTVWSGVRLMF